MCKKIIKTISLIIGGIILILSILVMIIWAKSPGKAEPITGPDGNRVPGSISSIETIILGGQEQYLIIRGADTTKPVMLFLHGGPGSPEIPFMKHFNTAIEEDFIMIYWEQRGAGKSYSKHISAESMNLSQFISDTRELSELLAKRFNQEKIFIMGHSWGSQLGILTAYRHPELFYSYFGIGQVAYQYKGELLSYEWVKEQADERNDRKAARKLSEVNFPDSVSGSKEWFKFLKVERKYVTKFGGAMREVTGMWPVFKMVLNTKEYTFGEKVNYLRGNMFSLENMWTDVINTNLLTDIHSMRIPVYIFQGVYDYQTPYSVAREFFNQLKAPEKEFYSFENSAHSPLMEEADKFNSIVRRIAYQIYK